MAEAFESGKLPEPARLPAGSVAEQAAELEEAVTKADSSSTAALYAAVLAAGFGVRDRDGSVLQTVQLGRVSPLAPAKLPRSRRCTAKGGWLTSCTFAPA